MHLYLFAVPWMFFFFALQIFAICMTKADGGYCSQCFAIRGKIDANTKRIC